MIVEPMTLPTGALVSDALALMERYHISGVPITDGDGRLVGILTNRDLRFERNHDQPVSALMTSRDLITAPGRHDARPGRAAPAPAPDREAARSSTRDGRLKGLITVKDIAKRVEFPDSTKDAQGRLRVGAAVGVGVDALERAQALDRGGRRRARRRHGPRSLARRGRDGLAHRRAVRRLRGDRRQHRHRRGGRGADRCGCRRREGRDRAWVDLHDPRRRRCRRAADHGDLRRRRGGRTARRAGDRRRRHDLIGRRGEGDRGGGRLRDARLDARGHGRGAGRRHPRPRRALQGVPRHGLDRRDAARATRRTATSRATSRTSRSSSPRASRAGSPTRARSRPCCSRSSAACGRRWATAAPRPSRR